MNATVRQSKLHGNVLAVISKSHLHRLLIAASLCNGPTAIIGKNDSEDILATVGSLSSLGVKIETNEKGFLVWPIAKKSKANVNARESGSTLRFLLPIAAALGGGAIFAGEGRLAERPIAELVNTLNANGANILGDKLPLEVCGKLVCGDYRINGSVSSQFISGLLFALPLLEGDSKIIIEGETASKSYIDITLETLRLFKIKIEKTDYGFFVYGGQSYVSPSLAVAEGDWSNAAFWLVGGALCGDVSVVGLSALSAQGDKKIVDIFRLMRADVSVCGDMATAKASNLVGARFDASDIPDLVPALSVAAAVAKGESVISGVGRLRFKESDRLKAVMDMIDGFGISCRLDGDCLHISGGKLKGAAIDGVNDHRMVMSAAIGGAIADGETKIISAEAVAKSYPKFFDDYKSLGGIVL